MLEEMKKYLDDQKKFNDWLLQYIDEAERIKVAHRLIINENQQLKKKLTLETSG